MGGLAGAMGGYTFENIRLPASRASEVPGCDAAAWLGAAKVASLP